MKSHDAALRFGEFALDPENRLLTRDGQPVDIGGRYLDALILLVREPGQLISKDRLHEQVWRGVPVTDEALSQAIMALRRALGDDAARPRFIETVPRHGYRFVGAVESGAAPIAPPQAAGGGALPLVNGRIAGGGALHLVTGGIAGAAATGLAVGLVYGALAAGAGPGSALSLVLVLICVSMLAALVSGLGIAGGIALLHRPDDDHWWRPVVGGTLGGLALGGFASLLGLDTLRLLVGSAPERMTGAGEGAVIGCAVGLALWLASRSRQSAIERVYAPAIGLGGLAGLAIILAGGTLMAGSLAALVARFPAASLSMGWAQDPRWIAVAGFFEGALFTVLTVAGMRVGARLAPSGAGYSVAAMRPDRL